ncbi:MAG TPA: primosomal protein N', partial [Erwinia persicina]|nr:primosomal protein N' [Erwinia persicina]
MPYQRRRTIQKLTTHRNRIRTFSTTQCTLTGLIFHPDESMPVVQVALPVPLARNFDYLLPPHLNHAVVGGRVSVPFGKRKAIGVVVGIVEHSDFPLDQLKSVHEVLDSESLYPASLWRILLWAADYYHYPLG